MQDIELGGSHAQQQGLHDLIRGDPWQILVSMAMKVMGEKDDQSNISNNVFFSAIYIYIQFDMEIIWDNDVQKVKPKFFWAGCPIFRQAIQWCVGIRVLSVIRIIIQIMMYPFRRVITIFITTTITEQIWNNDEWRPPHSTKSHIDYVWPSCGWTPQGSPFETAEVGEHRLGQGDLLWDTSYTISISEGAPVHCLSW